MKLLYDEGTGPRAFADKQNTRDFLLKLAFVIVSVLLIGFGCYLVVVGNPVGEKIIWGTLGFIAGVITGKGLKSFK